MDKHSKARTAAKPAEHKFLHQLSWTAALLALVLALLLIGQGLARAEGLPQDDSSPSALDAAPDAPACTDNMDFAPEDSQPSPFDADKAAFRASRARPFALLTVALPSTLDSSCQGPDIRLDNA